MRRGRAAPDIISRDGRAPRTISARRSVAHDTVANVGARRRSANMKMSSAPSRCVC